MGQVSEAWEQLMAGLDELAPRSSAAVRPGSVEGAALVERELDIELPDELREWFTLHDGCGLSFDAMLLPASVPMSPAEAVRDTKTTYDVWSEFSDQAEFASANPSLAGAVAYTWLREYVMIGNDGCGGGLFVDTRPGSQRGCVRSWDKTEADDDYGNGPVAPSLSALVHSITLSLRDSASATNGYRATLDDGVISWRAPGE